MLPPIDYTYLKKWGTAMIKKNRPVISLNIFVCMFLILFTAKAFGFLMLSWWWVILPILIPAMLVLGAVALMATLFLISMLIDKW